MRVIVIRMHVWVGLCVVIVRGVTRVRSTVEPDVFFYQIYSRCSRSRICVVKCAGRVMCWTKTHRACGIAGIGADVARMRVWVFLCVVIVRSVCVFVRNMV